MSRVKTPSVMISIRVRLEILEPNRHAQPHGVADALVKRLRHAVRRGARGKPARLKHQNPARFLRPVLAREHQRHPRGLAGAGRRHQHGRVVRSQRRGQVRQRGIDRKR